MSLHSTVDLQLSEEKCSSRAATDPLLPATLAHEIATVAQTSTALSYIVELARTAKGSMKTPDYHSLAVTGDSSACRMETVSLSQGPIIDA